MNEQRMPGYFENKEKIRTIIKDWKENGTPQLVYLSDVWDSLHEAEQKLILLIEDHILKEVQLEDKQKAMKAGGQNPDEAMTKK